MSLDKVFICAKNTLPVQRQHKAQGMCQYSQLFFYIINASSNVIYFKTVHSYPLLYPQAFQNGIRCEKIEGANQLQPNSIQSFFPS